MDVAHLFPATDGLKAFAYASTTSDLVFSIAVLVAGTKLSIGSSPTFPINLRSPAVMRGQSSSAASKTFPLTLAVLLVRLETTSSVPVLIQDIACSVFETTQGIALLATLTQSAVRKTFAAFMKFWFFSF